MSIITISWLAWLAICIGSFLTLAAAVTIALIHFTSKDTEDYKDEIRNFKP